jgi:hypothetical protein
MSRTIALGVWIASFTAGLALAQEFPKPGPEHEKLQQLAGTWDAEMEIQGQTTKATATYKSICGGMWLQSDFEGDLGGTKFQGHGLDGYDQQQKKYVGVWVDSMSSAPLNLEGNYDAKKKLLVMTGQSLGPDGKPQKFKNTTEYKDKDHFTFKMFMVDDEGKDQIAFTIEYSRRK